MNNLKVLDEAGALTALDRSRVLGALETAFSGLVDGRSVQPTQTVTVFPDGMGDCIFYPGALLPLGLIGVKVSPYLSKLAEAGEYPVTAYTLLLSSDNGRPILLCDSYALTSIRTAATTALGLRLLMPEQAKSLALIGTGKVGREHLRFALQEQDWASVNVYSPSATESDARRAEVSGVAANYDVTFATSARSAVEDADVVMLCTSSGTPVVDRDWIKPRALVTSISTNSPGAHEIAPESLSSYDVYCDYRETAPLTAGEMKIAIEDGSWQSSMIVADLAELVNGAKPNQSDSPRFFRSTGLGIEDLAIASLLVGGLEANGDA